MLFNGCGNITKISIPDSVQMIEGSAFSNMLALENIEVDEANVNYTSEDGVLFNKNKTSLELYPYAKKDSVYTVPNTVTTIKSYSICELSHNLEKFIVFDNVTEISEDDKVKFYSHSNNLTIYGYEGTVIQEYANRRNINFRIITDENFNIILNTSKQTLNPGEEFEVSVNVNNIEKLEKGIIAFGGSLEYDTNILEILDMESQNDWDKNTYNEDSFKFITVNNKFVTEDSTIFKIKFKVKDTVSENVKTNVTLKNIEASDGEIEITAEDTSLEISIEQATENPYITSEKYNIEETENIISKILPNTEVSEFISNIETNRNIAILNKDGNELIEGDTIETGMTLKVGEEDLIFTLVVNGDINGDGRITLTDLAILKLYYIEKEALTGIELKAADINSDNKVSIADIAMFKLVIIEFVEMK